MQQFIEDAQSGRRYNGNLIAEIGKRIDRDSDAANSSDVDLFVDLAPGIKAVHAVILDWRDDITGEDTTLIVVSATEMARYLKAIAGGAK